MGQYLHFLPWLILGPALFTGFAGAYFWRQGQAATRHWGQQTLAAARLQSRLESLERLLESGTGTMFLWDADHGVRVFTQNSEAADADGAAAFSRLCGNLTEASRAELMAALEALRENGAAFAFPIFCTDQRTLACQGKPAGAGTALTVSDVSQAYSEIVTLRDALKETLEDRDFLRHAINGIPYPAWRRDVNDRLTWVNEAYCRAVDAASGDDAVQRGEELVSRKALMEIRQPGSSHRVGTVVAGQRRILDLFEVSTGKRSVGLAVDVTEIQDAQNEVAGQRASQRAILNHLRTPVVSFSGDGSLEFFNQGFADLWNLPAEWLAT